MEDVVWDEDVAVLGHRPDIIALPTKDIAWHPNINGYRPASLQAVTAEVRWEMEWNNEQSGETET